MSNKKRNIRGNKISYSLVNENFLVIISLDQLMFLDIDKKFLNLLIDNYDDIIPLRTVGGPMEKEIGEFLHASTKIYTMQLLQ
jgi:hypothetical protein